MMTETMANFDLVIISADEWSGIQRLRHRVADFFSKNHRVLFVENPRLSVLSVFRDPKRLRHMLRNKSITKDRNVYVYTPPLVLPFAEIFPVIDRLNNLILMFFLKKILNHYRFNKTVIWYFYYNHGTIVGKFNELLSIYTAHDVWEESGKRPKKVTLHLERSMLKHVDLAFFTSAYNYKIKKSINPNSFYMPHAAPDVIDSKINRPKDLPKKGRIIGYWGVIDSSSIDIKLVKEIAVAYPDDSIVLVGLCPSVFQKKLQELLSIKNIYYLGMKKREEMGNYVGCFDVGLIPYPRTPFRLKCSPLKVYDYMTFGIPTVSIGIYELNPMRKHVYVARDNEEFVRLIGVASLEGLESKEKRIEFCRLNSWESRMCSMRGVIEKKIAKKNHA